MMFNTEPRWVVIGNSGSGKSTLAERLGGAFRLPIHDLDDVHWAADGRKRPETEAMAQVAKITGGDTWIIEGVYGWLAEIALARATSLVWLDLPWAECREGLLARGLRRGMTAEDQKALLGWAEGYWTRTTSSSFKGHEQLYDLYEGDKTLLRSRADIFALGVTGVRGT